MHLDILADRESIRGETGGSRALTHEGAGGAIVSIPALALADDTVVSVEATERSSFLPTSADAEPLAELVLDLAGATLGTEATLSVEGTLEPGESVVLVRVERLFGVPRLVVVGLGQAQGERIVSVSLPGLPGVRRDGRYVFYRVPGPMGFATGETTVSGGASVTAWVEGGGLPFVSQSGAGVPYLIAVSRGHKRLDLGVQPLAARARPRPRGGGWFRPYVGTPFRAPAMACSGKVASAWDGVKAAGSRRASHLRSLAVSPTWQVQGAVWG